MKPITIIYNYQTLIAGILALSGAIGTVFIINRQIRETQRIERQRRERQNFASRAMMPAALSELIGYSSRCVAFLLPLLPNEPEQRVTAEIGDQVPPIPAEAIFTLRQCTEFGENNIPETVADLISKLQIQHARLASLKDWRLRGNIILRANIEQYIIDALELHARVSKLFPYARRETDGAPERPSADDVLASGQLCDVHDDHHPEIRAAINRRFQNK